MVFEHVVFTCAVFVCAILGRFPQRFRNIRNGLYRLGRACRRLGDVSRTVPVVFGMRLMIVLVIMLMIVVMMMRRVLVVIGVIVMFVIVRVMMAFLSVSMGGLVQSVCRCFQA